MVTMMTPFVKTRIPMYIFLFSSSSLIPRSNGLLYSSKFESFFQQLTWYFNENVWIKYTAIVAAGGLESKIKRFLFLFFFTFIVSNLHNSEVLNIHCSHTEFEWLRDTFVARLTLNLSQTSGKYSPNKCVSREKNGATNLLYILFYDFLLDFLSSFWLRCEKIIKNNFSRLRHERTVFFWSQLW